MGAIARPREKCGPDQPSPTVVMDAGVATAANLAWLREQGYDWISVNCGRRPAPPEGAPDFDLTTASRTALQAWSLGVEDGERRLYVRREAKKQKEDAILTASGSASKRNRTASTKASPCRAARRNTSARRERVGRIRERYARVSGLYDIHVDRDPGTGKQRPGPNAKAVRFASRPSYDEADASAGAYLLRTSRLDWNLQDIVEQYLQIAEVPGRVPLPAERTRPAPHLAPGRQPGPRPPLHRRARLPRRHLIRTRLKLAGNNLCWRAFETDCATGSALRPRSRRLAPAGSSFGKMSCPPSRPPKSLGGLSSSPAATGAPTGA